MSVPSSEETVPVNSVGAKRIKKRSKRNTLIIFFLVVGIIVLLAAAIFLPRNTIQTTSAPTSVITASPTVELVTHTETVTPTDTPEPIPSATEKAIPTLTILLDNFATKGIEDNCLEALETEREWRVHFIGYNENGEAEFEVFSTRCVSIVKLGSGRYETYLSAERYTRDPGRGIVSIGQPKETGDSWKPVWRYLFTLEKGQREFAIKGPRPGFEDSNGVALVTGSFGQAYMYSNEAGAYHFFFYPPKKE